MRMTLRNIKNKIKYVMMSFKKTKDACLMKQKLAFEHFTQCVNNFTRNEQYCQCMRNLFISKLKEKLKEKTINASVLCVATCLVICVVSASPCVSVCRCTSYLDVCTQVRTRSAISAAKMNGLVHFL